MKNRAGIWFIILTLLLMLTPAALATPAQRDAAAQELQSTSEYVVVYAEGVSLDAARKAIAAAGGTIVKENAAVGVATVRTTNANFAAAVGQQPALLGAVNNKPVGRVPDLVRPRRDDVEREARTEVAGKPALAAAPDQSARRRGPEPLADLQWDMAMIDATSSGSYAVQRGSKRVLVGIIDSGIDGSHPDLAPNFNRRLSRNFATDMPDIDGPCEYAGCVDPPDVDDNGHGSHVAGTVAAALNGLGIAGVAPNVTLVNVRGGQDSGYVFLQPVVDALVYSGDIGIDVVNMSFYIDPWLYNCANNPADSPAAQMEQRTVIAATQRALDYARRRGVTLVNSAGNSHVDLGNPTSDNTSPDYPPGSAYERIVDNSCLTMPVEGDGVIAVSSLGPSKTKADYSNYGVEQITVSAPGGYFRDLLGTPQHRTVATQILSTYPEALAILNGELNPDGTPNTPFVVRDCKGSVCAYYQYLQGTSMAAPHATGVVALIVSEHGHRDNKHNGLTLSPGRAATILRRTATETPCPEPRLLDYGPVGRPPEFNAFCEGSRKFNGFYGAGIVNALNAVTHGNDD